MKNRNTIFGLLICLYFSQGLPSGLLAHALPALMREYGVSLELIGAIKILALPWFLKFLWAPFIDQRWQRRNWILLFQGCVIPLMLIISLMQPEQLFSTYLLPFLAILFLLNTCSASQDIATDGLAAEQLPGNYLGVANSIQVIAYKIGMALGGSALLIFLKTAGWQLSFQLFSIVLTFALVPIFLYKNNTQTQKNSSETKQTNQDSISIKDALLSFVLRPGIWKWLLIIATYKVADELGSSMLTPMLIDSSYDSADIGYLKLVATACGLVGAGISGLIFIRMDAKRALIRFGILQSIGIGLFALIPLNIESTTWVYSIVLLEQFVDGLSTVALFAAMMQHCRKGLEGTDYTIQNSIHVMGGGLGAVGSGFVAANLGYELHFMIAGIIGLIATTLIVFLYEKPNTLTDSDLLEQT